MGERMTDLYDAFRWELEELEQAAAPVPAAELAKRVERTLAARRLARASSESEAEAIATAGAVIVGLHARRGKSLDAATAREPGPLARTSDIPAAPSTPPRPTE
jgi:hypothetical protein